MPLWTIGATLLGGALAGEGARDASRAQQTAAGQAGELYRTGAEGVQDLYSPYTETAPLAIDREAAILGLRGPEEQAMARETAFSGPGFEYMRDRVIGDINRGASARGQLRSGNRLAALSDRLQGLYASQEANYLNQLQAPISRGFAGTANIGNAQQFSTAGQANALLGQGNAAAQGTLGQAASYGSALADLGAYFGDQAAMRRNALTP